MCLYAFLFVFFFQLFLLKKKKILYISNLMYCMHLKIYRVSSLRGLSVCVCLRARLFSRSVYWEKRNVSTLNQFPPDPKARIPGCLYLSLLRFALAVDQLHVWFAQIKRAITMIRNRIDVTVTWAHMCWLTGAGPRFGMSEFSLWSFRFTVFIRSCYFIFCCGLKAPNGVSISWRVEPRWQQKGRPFDGRDLMWSMPFFWLLPGLSDDCPSVLVIHVALLFPLLQ